MAQPMYDMNLRQVAGMYYGESSLEVIRPYTPGESRVQCPECSKFYNFEADDHNCLHTSDNEPPVNYDPVRYDFECEF